MPAERKYLSSAPLESPLFWWVCLKSGFKWSKKIPFLFRFLFGLWNIKNPNVFKLWFAIAEFVRVLHWSVGCSFWGEDFWLRFEVGFSGMRGVFLICPFFPTGSQASSVFSAVVVGLQPFPLFGNKKSANSLTRQSPSKAQGSAP